MIALPTAALLSHLRRGTFDSADLTLLEQTSAKQLVEELRSAYRLTFQERQIGKKWEVSVARSFRAELKFPNSPNAILASCQLVPAYLDCVMLSVEADVLTGISRMTRLTAWPVSKPEPGLALKSGPGFKLDLTPDGWSIKHLPRRIVKLSEPFLRQRGWRFDHLSHFIPTP